jgi:hypothetical protein
MDLVCYKQASPIHPVIPGCFPPAYSLLIYCPRRIWNGTTMNPCCMHSPFVYSGRGAPPFYTFWSIDQMVMAEKDAIQNGLYALELYWMITLLVWKLVDEDITMSTTTPAAPPHQAPLPSLVGPITRARARDLNFVMLLKNEGPEE